jgi:protein-S-isoprenylcysteine O-methyltransferase Ste14
VFILPYIALHICAVYCTIPAFWLVIHPFVDRWRKHGRDAFRILLPVWFLFIVLVLLACYPTIDRTLYQTPVAIIPGAIFILLGVFVYTRAFPGFGHVKVSGLAELEPHRHDQTLVTSGIRNRVRHPIYLGHLLEVIGWSIIAGSVPIFVLALFGVITGAIMIRLEDRELESRFGSPYRDYRHRVPAILPRLF